MRFDSGAWRGGTETDTGLAAAQSLAARGFQVFPVDHPDLPKCAGLHDPRASCNGKRGKHPAARFSVKATDDPRQIMELWSSGPRNVGIACGPRLVVLDEDEHGEVTRWSRDNSIELPTTYTVRTARGRHFYFKVPADPAIGNGKRLFKEYRIDVRGSGGYVVAAGSVHESGVRYVADHPDQPVALLPRDIAVALAGKDNHVAGSTGVVLAASPPAPASDPNSVVIPKGQRRIEILRYAGRLRDLGLDRTEAKALLKERWLLCTQPQGKIPGARHEDPECDHPYSWDEAGVVLDDVFDRYAEGGSKEPAGPTDSVTRARAVDPALAEELVGDDSLHKEVDRLLVRDRARDVVQLLQPRQAQPDVDAGTLEELLARPPQAQWRIEDLLPAGGRMLISAQRKVGKTTLVGNLARCLLTGAPFLGRFDVEPVEGRVVVLNFELTAPTLARWMADLEVPVNRLFLVNLRGSRNLLRDPEGRAELIELIRKAEGEALVVDPFGRAFTGTNQNDAGEVGTWLVQLDELAEAAGCRELVVTAHAGWNGARTRGSSALEDWPDVIVTATRDEKTDHRFLRADGRDVHFEEDRLQYDVASRRLTLSREGSRRAVADQQRLAGLQDQLVALATKRPGLNGSQLESGLRDDRVSFQKGDVSKALRQAVEAGVLEYVNGPRNSKLYSPMT